MEFVNPFFLWALLALAVPIIIHLFNFRRFKTVYFTNVKFLKEVKEETASRSRLKHWLVLLSRLLALTFLVLAFAQPFLPKQDQDVVTGNKAISVFIDNSFSMKAQSQDVSLFEKARQKAREVADAFGSEDKFQLITHDLEGKHQRMLSKEAFLTELEQLEVSANVNSLSNVLSRQKQVLEKFDAAQKNIFVISDFQKSIVDFETDTTYHYYFVPLQSVNQQNVFVDSLWFEAPVQLINQTNKLLVRINNTGDAAIENTRIELSVNNEVKAINNVSLPAKTTKIDTISFRIGTTGWHQSKVTIADYPINFDDSYFFTFFIPEKIKVLSINEGKESNYVNALFKDQNQITLDNQSSGKVEYASIPKYQLVVLNGIKNIASGLTYELQQYLTDGGNLLIFPNGKMDAASYKELTKVLNINNYEELNYNERTVNYINTKQEIFNDVFERIPRNIDLPKAIKSFDMTRFSSTNEEVLLRFNDQKSFLSKYNYKSGKVYMAATPLNADYSNAGSHAIFVPMMLKMVLVGAQNNSLAFTVGGNNNIEVANTKKNKDAVYKLRGETKEFIPGQKAYGSKINLAINNQMQDAGIYELVTDTEEQLSFFGFNFNRKESILDHFSLPELKEQFFGDKVFFIENFKDDITQMVGEIDKGIVLWKLCVILALTFLAIEILLLRLLPG